MMAAIAGDEQVFSIEFDCSGTGKDCTQHPRSLAHTDATVGGANDQKTIAICDPFWTYSGTRFFITPKEDESPPYRPKTASGWCGQNKDKISSQPENFFATAGKSMLCVTLLLCV
jgi:hypothetical protein